MTAAQSWPHAGAVAATASALGNVELLPASRYVLEIASGIVNEDSDLTERVEALTEPARRAAATKPDTEDGSGYWVQLGALSEDETARRYWITLKQRHATLLQNWKPRFFGPTHGSSGLHHIRLGPLKSDAASELCEALEAEGADCFCVRPPDEQSP